MINADTILRAFACSPEDVEIAELIRQTAQLASCSAPLPERKSYSDVVYDNYQMLGLSLQFEPANVGSDARSCASGDLCLAAVDLYGHQDPADSRSSIWKPFVGLPLTLHFSHMGQTREAAISRSMTGKQFVSTFGEPTRKGGGDAGRMGPPVWMEWQLDVPGAAARVRSLKLLVELTGAAVRGPDRWSPDRAGSAQWGVLTLTKS
ncbi:hypothetical protein BCV70DRAFT_70484 [Testicularia cyperi]|uniref:Uncharacterized protein n=1 Tax=Testicularia cyperi TaxID=1882483 RepID=A0A317XFQ8_9BASI|nr:hypothetical protein BCV70DRAFT_70484 [Testicularia cyperi]